MKDEEESVREKKIKTDYVNTNKKKSFKLIVDNETSTNNKAYWESTLFSGVYLNNDLKRDFDEKWSIDLEEAVHDENGDTIKSGFYHFYNEFQNIAPALRALANRKLTETDTITKIIAPVLDALGWYDKCQNNVEEPYVAETTFSLKERGTNKGKSYRTDMLLVDHPQEANYISDPNTSEARKKEARTYCIAPLEAKYWNRITDKEGNKKFDPKREDKKKDDSGGSLSFNEQALNYMEILHKKWGIVTDGNTWRLVHSEISGEDSERCFEFKLESLLFKEEYVGENRDDDNEFLENAKYFYLFFGKPSYVQDEIGKIFLDEVLKESRKYIDSIEEDLKDRFISAMNITCNALLRSAKESGAITKLTKDDLNLIRTISESHLFNILFIKSCESKGILPVKAPNYYKISLTSIIDRISVFDPEKYIQSKGKDYINQRLSRSLSGHKFKPEGTSLYKNLMDLTLVVLEGAHRKNYGFEIEGFKESVFSKEECDFVKKHCLTDEEMVQIFFQLGYSKSERALQRNYQQIPYNYFTPRQLGSIYESFLEYQLDVSQESMVYIKKGRKKQYQQWVNRTAAVEKKLKGFEPTIKKGQLFFTPDNSERKATGGYYTPDYIVQYIVKETIEPLCEGKSSQKILKLKVCDPAMGSGHFLNGALNFLTKKYLEALELEKSSKGIPTKAEAKRIVLDKCIFGVDINPRVVKLAKMSLWLESAHPGKKLERLYDQLKCGDSLSEISPVCPDGFNWSSELFQPKGFANFSALVTNPPYLGENDHREKFDVLKESPIWNYHCGKMDYWYFFVHRSLELVEPGGRVGMIATDYWINNEGAQKLREVLRKKCVARYLSFCNFKVFEEAKGQHNMILVIENTDSTDNEIEGLQLQNSKSVKKKDLEAYLSRKEYTQFRQVKFKLNSKSGILKGDKETEDILNAMSKSQLTLSNVAEIGQGLVPGPGFVTKRAFEKLDPKKAHSLGISKGDQVFIVKNSFAKSLKLNAKEESLLKPYLPARCLFNGKTAEWNKSDVVVYSTDENCTNQTEIPNLVYHLKKFKPLMDARRETKNGKREWFQLHWPREQELFEKSGIVAVRMTKYPVFAWTNGGIYFDASVNLIIPKNRKLGKLLHLYLQTGLVELWLKYRGKVKGSQLQVDGAPLKSIPIPDFKNFKNSTSNINSVEKFAATYFEIGSLLEKMIK